MQTHFTLAQLADPNVADANDILRACVHCGFCTATCPTYVLLGDELDSPRGRIYLIKEMLEGGKPATEKTVTHIDRCLSCLSCMTTCPSGVHYMHLVDRARAVVEETYSRPLMDRLMRAALARTIPYPARFRAMLRLAGLGKLVAPMLPARLKAMLALAPASLPSGEILSGRRVFPAIGERKKRVALLAGCAQQVLAPRINAATISFLTRHGCEVVVADGAGCCGALVHHMGQEDAAHAAAKANIAAWTAEIDGGGLDAVVINASGCGTTVKDYGYMLRGDPAWAETAARISAMTKDISEFALSLEPQFDGRDRGLTVAYHAACSLQHGQKVLNDPKALLGAAGFTVKEPRDSHLCCGSAGTYNMLQPELSGQLKDRKVATLEALKPDVVATGNIGCMVQIAGGMGVPVVHTIELLDWATGGERPEGL